MLNTLPKAYIAIDQGGHGSRVIIYDHTGKRIAHAEHAIRTQHPRTAWVEHNPQEMLNSITESLRLALEQVDISAFEFSAGLVTQRSSIVCWNKENGSPLTPVISWQDRRAAARLGEQDITSVQAYIEETTGLRTSPHYGASKLQWCMEHLSKVQDAAHANTLLYGPLSSYLTFKLCTQSPALCDPANASRTLLMNRFNLQWQAELLKLFKIDARNLPKIVPNQTHFGHIAASNTLRIPLNVVSGDQSAAVFAFGSLQSSDIVINAGTGVFIQSILSEPLANPSPLLSSIAYVDDLNQRVDVLEGTINGGAAALTQIAQTLELDEAWIKTQLRATQSNTEKPIYFINTISGLGSPYWLSKLPHRFIGEGCREQKMAAVCESILFLIAENTDLMRVHCPQPGRIIVTGGLTRINGFVQALSDLIQETIEVPEEYEATAFGLASLLVRRDSAWAARRQYTGYQPRQNVGLRKRYKIWQQHMHSAVAASN